MIPLLLNTDTSDPAVNLMSTKDLYILIKITPVYAGLYNLGGTT